MFVSMRIPFIEAAFAILTLHLNPYSVLSEVRTARAECQGKNLEPEITLALMCLYGVVNQQLHKYYKAFRPLMLRSIQAAIGGNNRNKRPLTKRTGPWPAMGIATKHLLSR
jgi:hypothetical protein